MRRTIGKAGFSLVEVVLSMGVVAVAFVPMMGLIPMGMTASRQAIDTTIQAQILQKMTGQAQETAFSSLSKMCDSTVAPLSFDANGALTTGTPIYKAAFAPPVNTVLPGGATTSTLNTITIYIVDSRTAAGQAASKQSDIVANAAARKYTVFVANTGL